MFIALAPDLFFPFHFLAKIDIGRYYFVLV
jgi:hypothetical protein